MKVIVDHGRCEANAVCVRFCPQVFRLNEDDTLTILVDEVPAELEGRVRGAAGGCPRQALSLQR